MIQSAIAERDVDFLVGETAGQRAIRRFWLSFFETDTETLEAGLRRLVETWRPAAGPAVRAAGLLRLGGAAAVRGQPAGRA